MYLVKCKAICHQPHSERHYSFDETRKTGVRGLATPEGRWRHATQGLCWPEAKLALRMKVPDFRRIYRRIPIVWRIVKKATLVIPVFVVMSSTSPSPSSTYRQCLARLQPGKRFFPCVCHKKTNPKRHAMPKSTPSPSTSPSP